MVDEWSFTTRLNDAFEREQTVEVDVPADDGEGNETQEVTTRRPSYPFTLEVIESERTGDDEYELVFDVIITEDFGEHIIQEQPQNITAFVQSEFVTHPSEWEPWDGTGQTPDWYSDRLRWECHAAVNGDLGELPIEAHGAEIEYGEVDHQPNEWTRVEATVTLDDHDAGCSIEIGSYSAEAHTTEWSVLTDFTLPSRVESVDFSPDGSLLAAASTEDGVTVWETDSWTEVLSDDPVNNSGGYRHCRFSPDGDHLMVSNSENGGVTIYETDGWQSDNSWIRVACGGSFSPDGQYVAITPTVGDPAIVYDFTEWSPSDASMTIVQELGGGNGADALFAHDSSALWVQWVNGDLMGYYSTSDWSPETVSDYQGWLNSQMATHPSENWVFISDRDGNWAVLEQNPNLDEQTSGSYGNTPDGAFDADALYTVDPSDGGVYEHETGTWSTEHILSTDDEIEAITSTIAVSDTHLAVGYRYGGSNGRVQVYERDTGYQGIEFPGGSVENIELNGDTVSAVYRNDDDGEGEKLVFEN